MRYLVVVALLNIFQSAAAHRDVSDTLKERQEIKQAMHQSLSSLKAALNSKVYDASSLSENALYLSKAAEFSAELFTELNEHSSQFSELYLQLIEQTAKAYDLSLKNNRHQLSTQIKQITNTCSRCHSMKIVNKTATHKNN